MDSLNFDKPGIPIKLGSTAKSNSGSLPSEAGGGDHLISPRTRTIMPMSGCRTNNIFAHNISRHAYLFRPVERSCKMPEMA
jgi:hypothetical protein